MTINLCILFLSSNYLFSQDDISQQTAESGSDFTTTQEDKNISKQIQLPQVVTYLPVSLENKVIYTKEQIQQRHFQDLPDLVASCGIQLLSYGPYGLEQKLSIRGFTDETVRVVIDGVCVNNPQTGAFDFSTINLDDIEKLEIIRGGFTEGTEDEGAVGGVIYITTKNQSLNHTFSSDTMIKSYCYAVLPVDTVSQTLNYSGPITQNLFLKSGGKFTYANNFFRENSAKVIDGNGNLQLNYYFGNGNSLTMSDLFYAGNKNLPGVKYSTDNAKQEDYNNNLTLNLFTPNVSKYFTLKNNFNWLNNNRYYEDVAEKSTHINNSFKYNSTLDFYTWKNIKEKAGITLEYTNINSTNDGNVNLFSGVIKETTKINLNNVFSLSLPMAAKFSGKNFAFVPKIGLSADFSFITITIDAYRMVQFPIPDDLYWKGTMFHGNPDLKTENGYGGDLIFTFKNNILPASINFFTNYYENKIKWAYSNGEWMPMNVASAFYFGIDFDCNLILIPDHLSITGNAEYLYTKLLDKSDEYTYGKKIMWTPDLTASFAINLSILNFNMIFSSNYTGLRYTSNLNIYYLKPYTLYNFTAEYSGFKYFIPYFKADNIMNTQYQSIENYPMPGISVTFGIRTSFSR